MPVASCRARRWGFRTALVCAVVLTVCWIRQGTQRWEAPLDLSVSLPAGRSAGAVPLVSVGEAGKADLVYLVRRNDGRLQIGYFSDGAGGMVSAPFAVADNQTLRLRIDTPSLRGVVYRTPSERPRVFVSANGHPVLDATAVYHPTPFPRPSFGRNTSRVAGCAAVFAGKLTADGKTLAGRTAPPFSPGRLASACLGLGFGWPLSILALSGAAAVLVAGAVRFLEGRAYPKPGHRGHLVVPAACLALSLVTSGWFITYGSGRVFEEQRFGDIFDYQALSLLSGRLDVPLESIGPEAFVHGGKVYTYFGPAPALLRLPFVMAGLGFGRLSRLFMLLELAGAEIAAWWLLRQAWRLLTPAEPEAPVWASACLVLNVGLGSTLLFLSSCSYVYHEAILCGASFALLAAAAALGAIERRGAARWAAALILGTFAIQARPPSGLFALVLTGFAALVAWRRYGMRPGGALAIGILALAGIASSPAVAYLKFQTTEGCPLRYNVQYDAARLARIDGKEFHTANLPFTLRTYFFSANASLEPAFPYLKVRDSFPSAELTGSKMDLLEPTLAVPLAMPALAVLACGGIWLALKRRHALSGTAALVTAAGLPTLVAMGCAIAVSHRYTADFVPWLVCLAAPALAALAAATSRWRRPALIALWLTTFASLLITFALTTDFQRTKIWAVPDAVKQAR